MAVVAEAILQPPTQCYHAGDPRGLRQAQHFLDRWLLETTHGHGVVAESPGDQHDLTESDVRLRPGPILQFRRVHTAEPLAHGTRASGYLVSAHARMHDLLKN